MATMSKSLFNAPDFLPQLGQVKPNKDPSPLQTSEERRRVDTRVPHKHTTPATMPISAPAAPLCQNKTKHSSDKMLPPGPPECYPGPLIPSPTLSLLS